MMSSYDLQEEMSNNQLCRPLKVTHRLYRKTKKNLLKLQTIMKLN